MALFALALGHKRNITQMVQRCQDGLVGGNAYDYHTGDQVRIHAWTTKKNNFIFTFYFIKLKLTFSFYFKQQNIF